MAGMFIIATIITITLSILSFKLIESKALRLKSIDIKGYFEKNVKSRINERRKRYGGF